MAKKPTVEEGMQKTLSVRVTEKVVAFLENTRQALERSGERASTSDVARQVLDTVVARQLPLGFSMDVEESLRVILRALRDDLPLTQHDYALLAENAHAAYQRSRRDFVRADLLLNNLAAFEAYIRLRNEHGSAERDTGADRYYFGNLGSAAQRETDLFAAVQRARELIQELGRPYRSTAEFMTRNLTILRDDIGLSGQDIDQALRPYAKGLLLLALKAYSLENDSPVDGTENLHEMQKRLKIQASLHHRNEGFSFSFLDGSEDLSVLVSPVSKEWYLSCNYQRFLDFLELIELDRPAEAEYFVLETIELDGGARVSVKGAGVGVGLIMSSAQLQQLRSLSQMVKSNPEYARVFSLLDLRYGRI